MLAQTFRIIKHPPFIKLLFAAIFQSNTHRVFLPGDEFAICKPPASFNPNFDPQYLTFYTLAKYVAEYYNLD